VTARLSVVLTSRVVGDASLAALYNAAIVAATAAATDRYTIAQLKSLRRPVAATIGQHQ